MKIKKINLVIYLCFFLSIIVLSFFYTADDYIMERKKINLISVCVSLVSIMVLIILYKKRLGFHFSYFLYLYLTHFGIYLVYIFEENPFYNSPYKYDWFSFNDAKLLFVSSTFIIIFGLTSILLPKNNYNVLKRNKTLLTVGYVLVNMFTCYYLLLIITKQLIIGENYADMHKKIGDIPLFEMFILLFALGIAFILSNVEFDKLKKVSIILVSPAFLLLITGNRGELFYPLLAGLGVLVYRNFKINFKILFVIFLTFFVLFPVVKDMRNDSTVENHNHKIDYSSSLVEVGYTLRPLSYVLMWEELNESSGNGISYYVAFQRQIANILGIDKISYENKPYSFRDRLPTMGFSVVAEAYYNFRIIGVIVVPIIISILLSMFYKYNNAVRLTFGTSLLAILINNIRNAFSFIPGYINILIIIIISILIIDKFIINDDEDVL